MCFHHDFCNYISYMSKLKEIISSGILEEFVLGNPSRKVQEKVAGYIIDYPEIKTYIENLELSLENMAMENAVPPPADWKPNILRNIKNIDEVEVQEAPTNQKTNSILKYAASFLLGGFLIGALAFYQQNKLHDKLVNAEATVIQLQDDCENEKKYFVKQRQMLDFIQDPNTDIVLLESMKTNLASEVLIYWNKDSREAFAKIHLLPTLPELETYQLWADVNGEMVNVGLLPNSSDEFVSLQFIAEAESLNVTIEPKGGSEHPTVSRLVMSTKV